jgi:hypothetical protein
VAPFSTGFGNPLVILLDVGCRRVADIFAGCGMTAATEFVA